MSPIVVPGPVAVLVWLLPGLALTSWIRLPDGTPRGMRAALIPVYATALAATLAAILLALGRPPGQLPYAYLGAAGLAVPALGLWLWRRRPQWGLTIGDMVLLASVVLLAVAAARGGGMIRWASDGPDHVGTVREILTVDSYFPSDAFYKDAGLLGKDARKGLLSPVYAGYARLTGMDPVELWSALPAVAAPLFFLGIFAFAAGLGLPPGWSLAAAWAVLLTWHGGLAQNVLPVSAYPNQVGAACFWGASGFLLLTVLHGGWPRWLASMLLLFGCIAIHPMFVVFVAMLAGAVAVVALGEPDRWRRWGHLALILAPVTVATTYYMVYRFRTYAPDNPIHTELQGMLLLTDHFFMADPLRLWAISGAVGLVAYPALLILLLPGDRRIDPGRRFLFWGTLGVLLLTWNPILVPLLQDHISYLIFRLFWFVPPGLVAVAVFREVWIRSTEPDPRPLVGWVLGAVTALAFVPFLTGAAHLDWLLPDAETRGGRTSILPLREPMLEVTSVLPDRSVILSDPITGYAVPALTSHKTVAVVDQHSPPNDSLAVRRMAVARDVLSASTPTGTASALAHAVGADAVLVRTAPGPVAYTMLADFHSEDLQARAREFAQSPAFELLARNDAFALFRPLATSAVSGPPVSRMEPLPPALFRRGAVFDSGDLRLWSATVARPDAAPGDTLTVDLVWSLTGSRADYARRLATIRVDALYLPFAGQPGDKWMRKATERIRGERYRTRVDWSPGGLELPVDQWVPGMAFQETRRVPLPGNLTPGVYTVSVAMNRIPHVANHRLRDYISDRDLYSGTVVDTVVVHPR